MTDEAEHFGELRSELQRLRAEPDRVDLVLDILLRAPEGLRARQLLPYARDHARHVTCPSGATAWEVLRWFVEGYETLRLRVEAVQGPHDSHYGCLSEDRVRAWCCGLAWLFAQQGTHRNRVTIAMGRGQRTYLRFNESPDEDDDQVGRVLVYRDTSSILNPGEGFDWAALFRGPRRISWPGL